MIGEGSLKTAVDLLDAYLSEFPEQDQGDFRVWEAKQIINRIRGGEYITIKQLKG